MLWLLSRQSLYLQILANKFVFVVKDASGSSGVKQQRWNRKVNLDFPCLFADFSVFISMLTFLSVMLFMLTCTWASMLSCFIFLAVMLMFADNQLDSKFLLWWAFASKLTSQFSAKANMWKLLSIFFRVDVSEKRD